MIMDTTKRNFNHFWLCLTNTKKKDKKNVYIHTRFSSFLLLSQDNSYALKWILFVNSTNFNTNVTLGVYILKFWMKMKMKTIL